MSFPVMPLNEEIPRLRDLLMATGRMKSRIVSDPQQAMVIKTPFPRPWQVTHGVSINFDLWGQLTAAQRDLLFLREVTWLTTVKVLKVDIYQGITVAGLFGFLVELAQFDAIGMVTAGGLTAFAGAQIWRQSRGDEAALAADETALATAQRRGYAEIDAARALLTGIEAIARIESRPLSFTELLRCQQLRSWVEG